MNRTIIYFLLMAALLSACSTDPKKALEKNIQSSLEIYLKAQLEKDETMKGAKLDSLVITKVDTVTPLFATRIYMMKLNVEMQRLEKLYQLYLDMIENKTKQNQIMGSISSDPTLQQDTKDEERELEQIKTQYLAYKNSVDSCQRIIDDSNTDNKTIVGYYAHFRIKVTKSDMTQQTLDEGGMQLTKDFHIIENKLDAEKIK